VKEIRFLSTEQVLGIHRRMIERYGGDAGVRDLGLIESATMMPQQTFGGELLHPTVGAMAAAYLFHLCANHGFVDGNKRTALAAALVFLDANGYLLELSRQDLERLTMEVAASKLDKDRLTRKVKAACRRRKRSS
jgi:death on curing protein